MPTNGRRQRSSSTRSRIRRLPMLQIIGGAPVAVARACIATLVLVSPGLAAAQPQLGDAPMRFESQDATGWIPAPKAAPTRDGVAALYNGMYLPGSTVPLQWTGSVPGCNPGATSVEHQQAVIARVNYFRALVDLPPVSLLQGTATAQVQAAALMMSANN